MEAGKNVKVNGEENNLLELIANDSVFNMTLDELEQSMDPAKYTGRSKEQVDTFLKNVVNPVLKNNANLLGLKAKISV